MTWKLPQRRFPHSSIASASLGETHTIDGLHARLVELEKALTNDLDLSHEELSRVLVGVPLINQRGQLTISEANTSGTATFTTEEADTNYSVFLTPVAITGAPASGAFTVKTVTKATTGITPTLVAAPGAGTSVTFDYIVVREIVR